MVIIKYIFNHFNMWRLHMTGWYNDNLPHCFSDGDILWIITCKYFNWQSEYFRSWCDVGDWEIDRIPEYPDDAHRVYELRNKCKIEHAPIAYSKNEVVLLKPWFEVSQSIFL